MNSHMTRRFRDLLAAPPVSCACERDAYELFRRNPSHPGLRLEGASRAADLFSPRGHRLSSCGNHGWRHYGLVLDWFTCGLRQTLGAPVIESLARESFSTNFMELLSPAAAMDPNG